MLVRVELPPPKEQKAGKQTVLKDRVARVIYPKY